MPPPARRRAPARRAPARRVPAPSGVVRHTLDNGLRVVLAPDRAAPVVGVAVYYDVGFRSEPAGLTGFAHLFEHLMFQGSQHVVKTEHVRLVQSAGGVMNGSTRADYTNYFQALPSEALELALWLEADRMRSLALTRENLDNQVAVVIEEINVNVTNQPYGGFPWILMPPVVFDTFANAHNGYGAVEELRAATLEDAERFFDTYYAPGNAVLTLCGDLDPDEAIDAVQRLFGDIPARAVPARPDFAEPPLTTPRSGVHTDPLAPTGATAVAWRVPDPCGPLGEYLPHVVLAGLLADSDASRLQRSLVKDTGQAVEAAAYLGTFGDPFDTRDPALLTVEMVHGCAGGGQLLETLDATLAELVAGGLHEGELDRVVAGQRAALLRDSDQVLGRTLALSVQTVLRDDPDLVATLPAGLTAVTADQVLAAAATLRADNRAVLDLVPAEQS